MTMRSAIPSATYRLQLHANFTLAHAEAHVGYFRDLGISHLYLSPVLTARAGSMHGYDVVDHSRINPELGGETAFRSLATACQAANMGLIVDIVPNHMAVGGADNPLWLDVLEHGAASRYAAMFDIDFDTPLPGLAGKVLAPLLGEPYGQALAEGKISLIWDAALGKLAAAYGPHRFPIRAEDYLEIVCDAAAPANADLSAWRNPEALHALLERQNYRLAWWRSAGDALNWRRFFDVNELAGLRIEDKPIFDRVHEVTLRLYREGLIDGVRVDHVDGLADPAGYLERLRARLTALNHRRPPDAPGDGPYIVVEKILGLGEPLSASWKVQGTSGYDFMDEISALQHVPAGQAALDALWTALSGRPASFEAEEIPARTEILHSAFAGQLGSCARALAVVASSDRVTRDLTTEAFRRALVGLINNLRVYRSYDFALGAVSLAVQAALNAARAASPSDQPSLDVIERVLRGEALGATGGSADAARRLNQLAAPVAAKAVEDTAFYRYSRLLSRTDVGFDPRQFSLSPSAFLATGAARARDWPNAMLTTATHDHKRGEDVRARLAVLSELPAEWAQAVGDWLNITAATRPAGIAADDAYALFQTLVGAWPLSLKPNDTEGLEQFSERVAGWRQKSLREAKLRSSWTVPDLAYEAQNGSWLENLLDPGSSSEFLESVADFVARIATAGAINGVVQAALRCTWPGVPDLYQGAELWDLSLVDPDNRRPVDYDAREKLLQSKSQDWLSGGAKQYIIAHCLRLRRTEPELFTRGTVKPLRAQGERADHVLAFERRLDDRRASVAVMLHVAGAVKTLLEMPTTTWWGDTKINIDGRWRPAVDLFSEGPAFIETGAA